MNKSVYDVNTDAKRLKTFKKWPFEDGTCMSKEKMAAAGFYFVGSKKEPDLVKCYVCLKELDGWEEEDDPWEEHKRHASYCQLVELNKKTSELTFQDMHNLEMYRNINLAEKIFQRKIEEFKKQAEKTRQVIENL